MSLQRCLDLKDLEKLKTFPYTVRKLGLKAKQLHFWATDCPDCQFKKGLLLSLSVKENLKLVNIWQSYKQERGCLMNFVRLANALLKYEKGA